MFWLIFPLYVYIDDINHHFSGCFKCSGVFPRSIQRFSTSILMENKIDVTSKPSTVWGVDSPVARLCNRFCWVWFVETTVSTRVSSCYASCCQTQKKMWSSILGRLSCGGSQFTNGSGCGLWSGGELQGEQPHWDQSWFLYFKHEKYVYSIYHFCLFPINL